MANTLTGVRSLTLTHVAYVPGFITSLIGLARCRKMDIHFDSGRDLLYKGNPGTALAYLEHDGGHWLVDADALCCSTPLLLSSFGTTYRPSIQRIFNYDITDIKTDNERGYGTSPNFLEELWKDLGIRYEPRAEYTEEQNGLAERAGLLLVI
ncbi:hypothetical protein EJ02DRAFT_426066 [Clathrospora elynae]|uniref:Integrase catalytic domain-containing protein n=1 Tax=Clathrospora elynae TaxID=706981 RepID=A0A6A5SDE4_9PLEO|nr:hypothetical protein EJ02DRAFT_426066 [Clathrospora elynae]